MASRATRTWRSMLGRFGGQRSFASAVDAADGVRHGIQIKGEFMPLYMVFGMVLVAVTIATHSAKQQLMHAPSVHVNKKRRESVPEVEDPDRVISSADKFVNKSFFRKIAHIQEPTTTLHDPVRPDPFTRTRNAETLKSVGVNPSRQ